MVITKSRTRNKHNFGFVLGFFLLEAGILIFYLRLGILERQSEVAH